MINLYLRGSHTKPKTMIYKICTHVVPEFDTMNSAERWIKDHSLDFDKKNIRMVYYWDEVNSFKRYVDIKIHVRNHHMF